VGVVLNSNNKSCLSALICVPIVGGWDLNNKKSLCALCVSFFSVLSVVKIQGGVGGDALDLFYKGRIYVNYEEVTK
jgi:hypothetical protein